MKRILKRVVVGVLIAVFLVVAFMLRFPSDPLVYCQKAIDSGFVQWKQANRTNGFPNIEGDGERSFAAAAVYMSPRPATYLRAYGYVPGLKDNDPEDLVLMYLKEKTRRTWNGDHAATVFRRQKWMVLGPEIFDIGHLSQYPEGGCLLTTEEFTARMQRTFQFLKENKRPYWQRVVNEHAKFLNSIKE